MGARPARAGRREVIQMDEQLLNALREGMAADVACPRCGEVECTFQQCRDLG